MFPSSRASAQTSGATLSGEVRNAQGVPLEGVRVFAELEETGTLTTALTNRQGQYVLQFMARGLYKLSVEAVGYRPVERREIELHVAEQRRADFQLEALAPDQQAMLAAMPPGNVSRGGVGVIYGPDARARMGIVDTRPPAPTEATSSTLSGVIDIRRIRDLPLAGRDIYTLFVLLPGVTSDNATNRGLGFSVNGFRVSSSNYLLDGVDNNQARTTAPGTLVSPEAIREYRLATSNFSAEYGRGAFVANVLTQAGSNHWRGNLFEFLFNDKLNANSYVGNASGQPRPPLREHQYGYALGGPLRQNRAFLFTSLEALNFTTLAANQTVILPRPGFSATAGGPLARSVLERFPTLPLAGTRTLDANRVSGQVAWNLPMWSLAASARLDLDLRPDRDRMFLRFASFDQSSDNFSFSPYRGLSAPLSSTSRNVAVGHIHRFAASLVNESKVGWNRSGDALRPAVPGLPELASRDGTRLPGNEASQLEQEYRDDTLHLVENFSRLLARHHFVAGGEFQAHFSSSLLAPGRIGSYTFADLSAFAADQPRNLTTSVDRFSIDRYRAPDYTRDYRQNELALFFQDNWRIARRLTLNVGLRYESFGVPHNSRREEDLNYYLGPGTTPFEKVGSGGLRRTPDNPGDLRGRLYRPDRNNLAPRFGLAWDVSGNSQTVVRAGYGIYYDRLFNLLWDALRKNSVVGITFDRQNSPFTYSASAPPALPVVTPALPVSRVFGVEAGLRTPYVQTWFAGLQRALGRNTLLEVDHTGSLGRRLAARDFLNRNPDNSDYGLLQMLSNQGSSDFLALEAQFLRRFNRGFQFQAAYTWSHAIDNQGDPLVIPQAQDRAFQREFDAAGDRGNADFDQRHNLVMNFLWRTPRLLRSGWWAIALSDWQVSGISGFRTGFPLTVVAQPTGFVSGVGSLVLPRADFLGGSAYSVESSPAFAGRVYLDRSRFANPGDRLGNTGRGTFRGPGFWNQDLSVGREFPVPRLGDGGRLQLRADFFNLFNHANLGNPDTLLFSPSFGVAQYGRRGFSSEVIGTSPLNEISRRVQLAFRIMF